MSDITDLFDPRLRARRSDPSTSHDAAASMMKSIGAQHVLIIKCFKENGNVPMAAEQVSDKIGIDIWRRFNELRRYGYLERTDEKHLNRSGRQAFKHKLTEEGLA